MPAKDSFQGVSNCYVFKSRLQEYAQKVGLPTPVYETIKEGPSHEPTFYSTVIVKDVRYDSLPGFSNRKAAEQSAAEVALMELSKSNDLNPHVSLPVHETGLCKNLLQEYAQKMNFAIPLYQCKKDDSSGRTPLFSCTVEIGGIRYIGAAAKTKKEAEIKAARTALLAIQSCPTSLPENSVNQVQLTVIPCKRKEAADCSVKPKTAGAPRIKKGRFKKVVSKKKGHRNGLPNLEFSFDRSSFEPLETTGVDPVPGLGESVELAKDTVLNSEYKTTDLSSSGNDVLVSNIQSDTPPLPNGNFGNDRLDTFSSNQINCSTSDVMSFPLPDVQATCGEVANVATGVTGELH
ncbi:double-stranded RNA-binding protein 1-like [Cucurbita pepo subsp. pepo]|uniref:double-stranded RNA-binding protein 1-like n=1 Tax=Cucurbita pepo subsp. pepo TaxID=3664 RepID=UPI000C9D6012|nr:double-stranded RNA-binding protein 1-like [Cucurbita pepo subsp. pepo]